MLDNKGILYFSATDLVSHLSCNHLTQLDAGVARDARAKPKSWNLLLEVLRKRGGRHEQAYLDHLEEAPPSPRLAGWTSPSDRAGAAMPVFQNTHLTTAASR
ncbi:MAG: hypothetical protein OXE76_11355 [Alphaproteobacteria bacterium]|nr:hypothetical protein [Alphaproteobacteria bacterium]